MSLLRELSADIVGGSTFGGYFTNLTVENTTTLNGDIVLGGGAVSTVAPVGATTQWLVVIYNDVEYKVPLTAAT
jgi:hypothetical protein